MSWIQDLWFRVKSLIVRSRLEDVMNDEMAFHIDMAVKEKLELGMSPKKARSEAIREFGGMDRHREECRDAWGTRVVTDLIRDVRLSARSLWKTRAFAVISILTLAIGIGSTITIYSGLRALVLQPFDYPESDQLVQVWSGTPGWKLSAGDFLDLHEQSSSFSAFGAYGVGSYNIGEEDVIAVTGVRCTSGALQAFGVKPMLGRWLEVADDVTDAAKVAVVSYELWQNNLGGDVNILGKGIRLNGGDFTVVGIMPAGFEFTVPWARSSNIKVWVPMSLEEHRHRRSNSLFGGIARLRENANVETANADINAIGARLKELYPDSNSNKNFLARSLRFEIAEEQGNQIWLLFVAVALVLLVACSNVASMLLARSAKRQGEFCVRLALGARRGNLVRLALADSLTLAFIAAIVGIGLAYGGIEVFKAVSSASEARKAAMSMNGSVLLLALGATFATALLVGLPPVFLVMKTSLAAIMRQGARGTVGSKSRYHMLRILIIAQVAVAFVLANGAALFSTSYFKLLKENEILDTENVVSLKLSLRGAQYAENEDRVRFWYEVAERIEALPGVTSVGLSTKIPLEGGTSTGTLINDEIFGPSQRAHDVERSSVTEGYFKAMGIALLQGRNLQSEDAATESGDVGVVVNQAMVEMAWPDKNPIGEIMRSIPSNGYYRATVVGVVENVKQRGAAARVQPELYRLPKEHWGTRVYVIVRSSRSAYDLVPQIKAEIAALDSGLAFEDVRTLRQVVLDATQKERTLAGMVSFFMATAIGLVAVGIYGTLSYNILQRTAEIGVRRALGALRSDITKLVLRQGAGWVSIGLVIGIAGAFAITKTLVSMIYGMEELTVGPLALAAGAVVLTTFAACWLPARRAARMDPLDALRSD